MTVNTLVKSEKWASVMQWQLRQSFVWKYIANTRFEWYFEGNKTVNFKRQAKVTYSDMATSYVEIPVQWLVETNETFTLSKRKWFAVQISDEDYKEIDINPDSQVMQDAVEQWAKLYDTEIMSNYIYAWLTLTDWDMETASNSGWANSIKLSKSNIYDLCTAAQEKMDTAPDSLWNATWLPDMDRWIMLSPSEKRLLAKAPELLRSTQLWDKVVTWGYMWEVDGLKVYYSNNLASESNIRWWMFGQWKPIHFGSLIKPKVEFVGSETQANSFLNTLKSMTYYGSKVFAEWVERLWSIKIYKA